MGNSTIKNPRRVFSQPGGGGSGTVDGSGTANEITYWVDSNTIGALAVATYPSLTELSRLKGVTSSVQTQLDAKSLKNYSYTGQFLALNPADATNYHFNGNSIAPSSTDTARAFKFNKAGTVDRVYLAYQQTTNGSNETINLYLRNVTAGTDASVGTFTSDFGGSTGSGFNFEGLSLSVNATDFYTWKITTPTWATNPAAWIGNLMARLLY